MHAKVGKLEVIMQTCIMLPYANMHKEPKHSGNECHTRCCHQCVQVDVYSMV